MMWTVYEPSFTHDILLERWFFEMVDGAEFATTFASGEPCLSNFLLTFRSHTLWFELDEAGIMTAAWWGKLGDAVVLSYWIAPRARKRPSNVKRFADLCRQLLTREPLIIGITCQENLLDIHRRLGYTIVGKLPGLWRGCGAWLMTLTEQGLIQGLGARRSRRREVTHG